MRYWHLWTYGHADCVDTLTIAMVELPHELKKIQKCPVEFLSTSSWKVGARSVQYTTNDNARQAGQSRRIQPDDQVGAGQAQVEGAPGVVAFADPGISCERIADPFTELRSVWLDPARLPEQCIQVHYWQAETLAQGTSQSGLAAASIAQDHNPLHEGLPVAKKDGDFADYCCPVNSAHRQRVFIDGGPLLARKQHLRAPGTSAVINPHAVPSISGTGEYAKR